MLVERIAATNFLIFKSIDLDLSGIKLASVTGQFSSDRRRSNGAGKTALFECIRYAVYDEVRGKQKSSIVRSGQSECEVDLRFSIGSKKVRVVRNYTLPALSKATVWIDGRVAGDKVRVVNDVIRELIGIDGELFDSIFFFKQGDQFGFVDAGPSDRKAALTKVFRLQVIEKCHEEAKRWRGVAENAKHKLWGTIEALRSRTLLAPTPIMLRDQDLAISGDLASALQLQEYYGVTATESALDHQAMKDGIQDFDAEVKKDIDRVGYLLQRVNEISNKIAQLQAEIQMNTSVHLSLVTQNQQLQNQISSVDGLKVVGDERMCEEVIRRLLVNASIAQEKHNAKVDLLELVGKHCPTCRQIITVSHVEHVLQKANREKEDAKKVIDECNAGIKKAKANLAIIKEQAKKKQEVAGWRERFESNSKSIELYSKTISKANAELASLEDERSACLQEQSDINNSLGGVNVQQIRNALNAKLATSEKLQTERLDTSKRQNDVVCKLVADYESVQQAIKDRRKVRSELRVAVRNGRRIVDEFQTFKHLTDIFSKNGMQSLIVENAIGVIESFANEILRQMRTPFLVTFKTTKESTKGELRESLDIVVFDNGQERAFEVYSGGERAMINIAIRLALSKVISSLYNVKVQSLFLDEVLGALDEVNREEVIKIISYLSQNFDQVFVISHTNDVNDLIDSSLQITRNSDHSTVAVVRRSSKHLEVTA